MTGNPYDGEGNPTTYNGTSLTFDPEDRMTSYGTALTNGYMDSGLRAWKQNAAGTRTYFLYDGAQPVCELNAAGAVTAVNTFGADGLISRRVGSTSTFYTFDLQGGNAQRLDAGGNVLASAMFDAYGTRASTDGSADPFSGYGGQWGYYTDSETATGGGTGLELCTYRYYDPANGRFINRDPIGTDGGVNIYNYVINDPTDDIDSLGLIFFKLNGERYTLHPQDADTRSDGPHWHGTDGKVYDQDGYILDPKDHYKPICRLRGPLAKRFQKLAKDNLNELDQRDGSNLATEETERDLETATEQDGAAATAQAEAAAALAEEQETLLKYTEEQTLDDGFSDH